MKRHVSKGESGPAKDIWRGVERAAQKTPDWVKDHVLKASQETVNQIKERGSNVSTKEGR